MAIQPNHSTLPRRVIGAALLAGAALWLAGCQTLGSGTPEQVVRERAQARWAALLKGDFEHAWSYTQPGFRALIKQNDYRHRFGGGARWKEVQVHNVTCEAERCTVSLNMSVITMIPSFHNKEITTSMDETWVREDGQWWFYQAL
ncbi:MAG: DUF4864 domain-containing protein [Burkholderiaceae bacterium]|nr:DUF4864 domain-containing protein [Burkholderiaceae bacterium]